MSEFEEESTFECPYCGQPNTIVVDQSGGGRQVFTTDCEVCCRPITVTVAIGDDGEAEIEARRESD